jgi:hypothetical protein
MIIRVPGNRAECFRRRIEFDAEFLEVDLGRDELTDEQRDWVARHVKPSLEFAPISNFTGICPPTKEEFLRVIDDRMSGTHYTGSEEGFERE